MNLLTLDIALFVAFLSINLIVGLLAGRRVKTLRTYAIGDKNFSTATLISTIIATWVSGGFMFYALSNTYTKGLLFIIPAIGSSLCLLVIGQFLVIRMGEFLNNLSVAEAMGDLYGTKVRILTAIFGLLKAVGYLAIQFQVASKVLTLIFEIQGPYVTITAAIIVIFYSVFGGIKAVTFTDVIQFLTFSSFIPILALIIWNNIKDPSKVVDTLVSNPIFHIQEFIGWNPRFMASLGLLFYFVIPGLDQTIFQRIAMAKDINQAKRSFTYASGLDFLIFMFTAWVGILLLADNPELEPSKLVKYLIDHYAYPGFKSLIAAGILAMAMSTADSYLNSSAVMLANDIAQPLKINFKSPIITARILSVALGIVALFLAMRFKDILGLVLLSGSFYMPTVTVPLLLTIFGFRSSGRATIIGMVTGLVTVVCWKNFLAYTGFDAIVPGMIANVIGLMGSHYIFKEQGGWVGIKDQGPLLAARQARKDAWQGFINTIKRPKLYAYLQKNLPAKESLYSLFGLYVIGATYASFFTIPEDIVANYQKLYDLIAHSVLMATFVFITYPAWPPTFRARWFITFAWPTGIFYILFVVGSILVMMSDFHQVQVMIFMLNLVIAALLLAWPLVLGLAITGIMAACTVFYLTAGMVPVAGINSLFQFSVVYGVLLFSSFFIALVRFKQSKTKLEDKNTYLLTIQAASRDQLVQVLGYREALLKELNQEEISLFDSTTAAYMQQAIYRMTDYLRLEVSQIDLNELIEDSKATLKLQDLNSVPQLIFKKHTQAKTIQADSVKIKQLLVDSISYIYQHNTTNNPISIGLEDTTLGHIIDHIKNYTRKLAALKLTITTENKLPPTQPLYMVSPTQAASLSPESPAEPALLENLRIIDAHYGYAAIQAPNTHVYVIPLNVRAVRGKVMELLREPAVVDPDELNHPLAIALEQKLLHKLQGTKVDLNMIQKALHTIKKYHGGVRRKSGEPFFTHPMQVALILMDYTKDQDAILGALLHDTVEDTSLSMAHIKALFGETVAFLVNKATNLEDKIRRVNLQEYETNYRLMNYEDERAAIIKLSDRLHNMRTIQGHSSLTKQKHIANETLIFFVPMAKHLDMSAMATELEELCFGVLGR